MTRRTLSLVSAAAVLAGMVMLGARPPRPPAPPAPAFEQQDVAPYELDVAAYRLDQLVIVVARGKNRTAGYTTRLELGKPDADPPEVVLRNIPPAPGDAAAQMIKPFDVTGYFEPGGEGPTVSLQVAGKATAVEVRPIREIPKGQGEGEPGGKDPLPPG